MMILHFLASIPTFDIVSLLNFCQSDKKTLKICYSHLFTMVREEPKEGIEKSWGSEGEKGREVEGDCSGGGGTPLGMCRGWMKAIESRCSQRHLAGSLLLHLPCGLLLRGRGVTQGCLPAMSWPQLPLFTTEANTCVISEATRLWAIPGLPLNVFHPPCSLCLDCSFPNSSAQSAHPEVTLNVTSLEISDPPKSYQSSAFPSKRS